MDIQEFVKASLVGIMSGIHEAQKEYLDHNSAYDPLICPSSAPPTADIGGCAKGHADKVHDIEFDLAITITESSSSKAHGTAGVKVVGVYTGDIGATAEAADTHSTLSRIRFKIPVRYPLIRVGRPNFNIDPDFK